MSHLLPLANMGTPLMWAGVLHLYFGNAAIGLAEGLLIAWLFKVRPLRAILCMIPANYFSMYLGMEFFSGSLAVRFSESFLADTPLYRIGTLLLIATLLSYVLTIFLEWPFVAAALWKTRHGIVRTFLASLIAQTASYSVLGLYYGNVSSLSLITQPTMTASRELIKNPTASVFFIDPQDHCIYQLPLDGSPRQTVGTAVAADPDQRLVLIPTADEAALVLCLTTPHSRFMSPAVPVITVHGGAHGSDQFQGIGPALDLRPSDARKWKVDIRFWSAEGLSATNPATNQQVHLALETPFISWSSRYATLLPGDQVIYQVGRQIVLLDLPTKRIAFLTRGYSPVVVLPSPPTTAASQPVAKPAEAEDPLSMLARILAQRDRTLRNFSYECEQSIAIRMKKEDELKPVPMQSEAYAVKRLDTQLLFRQLRGNRDYVTNWDGKQSLTLQRDQAPGSEMMGIIQTQESNSFRMKLINNLLGIRAPRGVPLSEAIRLDVPSGATLKVEKRTTGGHAEIVAEWSDIQTQGSNPPSKFTQSMKHTFDEEKGFALAKIEYRYEALYASGKSSLDENVTSVTEWRQMSNVWIPWVSERMMRSSDSYESHTICKLMDFTIGNLRSEDMTISIPPGTRVVNRATETMP